MNGLIARVHSLQEGMKYPDWVDLFHRRDGKGLLSGVVRIDLLLDLGVSAEAAARIAAGEEIEVVCMAAYELPEVSDGT